DHASSGVGALRSGRSGRGSAGAGAHPPDPRPSRRGGASAPGRRGLRRLDPPQGPAGRCRAASGRGGDRPPRAPRPGPRLSAPEHRRARSLRSALARGFPAGAVCAAGLYWRAVNPPRTQFGAFPATYSLLILIGLVFLLEVIAGGSTSSRVLLGLGANQPGRSVRQGEAWRMLTSASLHLGVSPLLRNGRARLQIRRPAA